MDVEAESFSVPENIVASNNSIEVALKESPPSVRMCNKSPPWAGTPCLNELPPHQGHHVRTNCLPRQGCHRSLCFLRFKGHLCLSPPDVPYARTFFSHDRLIFPPNFLAMLIKVSKPRRIFIQHSSSTYSKLLCTILKKIPKASLFFRKAKELPKADRPVRKVIRGY